MTNEIVEFLKENVVGHTRKELSDIIYNKFGVRYNENQIKWYKRKYGLKSGLRTTFKKGGVPHNKKPIGSEFKTKNGYIYVKVGEPRVWIQKQRVMYEKYYGKIPKGYSVTFLNQNKEDFSKENLILIQHKDKLVAKNLKLYSNNSDITKTGIMVAKLINKTHEKKLERN